MKYKNLANKLNANRANARKLTPAQIARGMEDVIPCKIDTLRRVISAILRGDRLPPEDYVQRYLENFAEKLNLSIDDLWKAYNKDIQEKSLIKYARKPKHKPEHFLKALASSGTEESIESSDHFKGLNKEFIHGENELIKVAKMLLKQLDTPDPGENEITLTFQAEKAIFSSSSRDAKDSSFFNSVESVLRKKYKLVHLVRLGNNQVRIREVIKNVLRFSGIKSIDSYELMAFKNKSPLVPPYGGLVLPNGQAILTISSIQSDRVDTGIYVGEKKAYEALKDHFKLLKDETDPVFEKYEKYNDFYHRIRKSEYLPGPRYVFLKRLSEITRPIEWYDINSNWAKALFDYYDISSVEDKKKHIESRKSRRIHLDEHLKKYECYYIYQRSTIRQFIYDGKASPYYFTASPREKVQQLQNFYNLLMTRNFNVALIDDGPILEIINDIRITFFEVIGGNLVFMEVPVEESEGDEGGRRWYISENRVIARGFENYLEGLWNSIHPDQKDNYEISLELLDEIKKIETEIENSKDSCL